MTRRVRLAPLSARLRAARLERIAERSPQAAAELERMVTAHIDGELDDESDRDYDREDEQDAYADEV